MIRSLVLILCTAVGATAGELTLNISGVRNDKGFVRALLFKDADGFPEDHTKAVARAEVQAKGGVVTLTFRKVDLKHGAVIVVHDENNDRKLAKNLVGIPREGVAASNWDGSGRPKFNKTVVELPVGKPLHLKLKYF